MRSILRSLLRGLGIGIFLLCMSPIMALQGVLPYLSPLSDCWTETDPTVIVHEVIYPQPRSTPPGGSPRMGNELPTLCRLSAPTMEDTVTFLISLAVWSGFQVTVVWLFFLRPPATLRPEMTIPSLQHAPKTRGI
jgi:hypothetical protein